MRSEFTAAEVAALTGLEETRVRKELEYGVLNGDRPPRFDFRDLVYFFAFARLGLQLGVPDRKRLYGLILAALRMTHPPERLEISPLLEVRLDRVTKNADDKIKRFDAWKAKLVTDKSILGGEPVFPRSRLAVKHIGEMLARGTKPEEIREDYPRLTKEDLEFASVYARAYPRIGRPRES